MTRNQSRPVFVVALSALLLVSASLVAQEPFANLLGPVKTGPVTKGGPIEIPYILWGGDVATFLANGDLKTQPASIFKEAGLDVQLVNGDDFVGQVRNYMQGKSPFLRGTMHMMGLASEVIGSDAKWMLRMNRWFPKLLDFLLARKVKKLYAAEMKESPSTR